MTFLKIKKIIAILQKIVWPERGNRTVKEEKKAVKRPKNLPAWLKVIFWDYDFRGLRWEEDRDLIISRILSHGDWQALQWLRSRVDSASLKNWLLTRRGAGLSARQLRFWELILDLPHREVNAWLKDKGRMVWERRAG